MLRRKQAAWASPVEAWTRDGDYCPNCDTHYSIGCDCWASYQRVLCFDDGRFRDAKGGILSTPIGFVPQLGAMPKAYERQANFCIDCAQPFTLHAYHRDVRRGDALGKAHWPSCERPGTESEP